MSWDQALLAALVAGLLASPHCLAMCGPLAAAGCTQGKALHRRDALGYVLGRLVSYATLGAVMGALGARALRSLPLSDTQSVVALCLAAFCAWRGIGILRRRPATAPIVSLGRKPKPGWRVMLDSIASIVPRRGLGLGLATGLLPCGALVAGWALAAATAHPVTGALSMSAFAVASLPGLGAAMLGRHLIGRKWRRLPPSLIAAAWFGVGLLVLGRLWLMAEPATASCH